MNSILTMTGDEKDRQDRRRKIPALSTLFPYKIFEKRYIAVCISAQKAKKRMKIH